MSADHVLILGSEMGHHRRDYEAVYNFSPSETLFEMHNHMFYEFYFHIRGGSTIFVNGQPYPPIPNTMMLFPPFQLHGYIAPQQVTDYERAFLYITQDLAEALCHDLFSFQQLVTDCVADEHYQFQLSPETHARCVQLIAQTSGEDASPVRRLMDYAHMTELMAVIAGIITDHCSAMRPAAIDDTIRQVLRYLDEHACEPLSLHDISARFGISQSTLCHRFQQVYNCSVYQYIQFRRITHAKELIAIGIPPTNAAYQCGFGSYSNFLRAFTQLEGCTPSAYQKSLQHR